MTPVKHIEKLPQTDEELLLAFKESGSQEVLAKLYLRYTDLVYGVCLKYLKDPEASKDAVMNIYHELLVKLLRHEVGNFKSWLYVLARNHCLMHLRSAKKMFTVEFDQSLMQSEDLGHLDAVMEKERDFLKLSDCIDELNSDQKQTIRLFYLENKCYNEITEMTGMDWNRVRSLIQNGRRNLKNCMEKNA